MDHEVLRLIALRETLTVLSESVLFDTMVRWCNCECKRRRLELSAENKRAVLGEDRLYAYDIYLGVQKNSWQAQCKVEY